MATNDEATTAFEESDLISLGEKLAALELTEPERAALGALISDDDVAGYARYNLGASIRLGLRNYAGKRYGLRTEHLGVRAGKRADTSIPGNTMPKPGQF